MMQITNLGQTGIHVSRIGLGTVKFGRNQGLKYPSNFVLPSDAEILALLDTAHSLGINLLDTAPAYGSSEERIGKLLAKNRHQWILMTKTGEEFRNGESFHDFSPEHTRLSIERSLKRLNTDYLDIVLLHSDGNDLYNMQHFGTLDCLQDLKKQGLLRAYGVSTKTLEGGLYALEHADVVMITYNPIETQEKPIITKAHENNKGVFLKKVLASGHLNKLGARDPVSSALQFVLQEPGVSSVIIGTLNPKHLIQNVKSIF